jgi:hypothetical protein
LVFGSIQIACACCHNRYFEIAKEFWHQCMIQFLAHHIQGGKQMGEVDKGANWRPFGADTLLVGWQRT